MIKQMIPTNDLPHVREILERMSLVSIQERQHKASALMVSLLSVVDELIAHRNELEKLTGFIAHNDGDSLSLEVTRKSLAALGYSHADK